MAFWSYGGKPWGGGGDSAPSMDRVKPFSTAKLLYLSKHFTRKEQNRWRNFYSSSGNPIFMIFFK